ncbi:MAG: DNA-binding protein [Candidatus Bathyarchaeota archaeon]|nr:DNA-binding protein [Candidatus Termiticorpusculum sp.]
MDYSQATIDRVFILRLYSGEVVHETLETFAIEHNIKSAICLFLGGAEDKSNLIVGPKYGNALPIEPMSILLNGVHEGCGVGTIFCNSEGKPKLHMHGSFGRNDKAVTGCMRAGVKIWSIGEIVMFELHSSAKREKDLKNGFELLKTH